MKSYRFTPVDNGVRILHDDEGNEYAFIDGCLHPECVPSRSYRIDLEGVTPFESSIIGAVLNLLFQNPDSGSALFKIQEFVRKFKK